MFKKDDYIVLLKYQNAIYSGNSSYILNHCYKQRENKDYLLTHLDSRGSTSNGWTLFPFNEPDKWRYATPEEVAEYERLGKPYDITTLIGETDELSYILSEGDKVVFEGPNGRRKYTVRSHYLTTIDGSSNDIIFTDLGLDKKEFCEKYYGYRGSNGDWPEYKSGDFKALTRVVNALHKECEKDKVHDNILKKGDIVEFNTSEGTFEYTVNNTFLSMIGGGCNEKIFDVLGIDKIKVASEMYGYPVTTGDWPSYRLYDFEAATRLVNHLHELCRKTLETLLPPPPEYISVDLGVDGDFGLTVTDNPSIAESITHFEYRCPSSYRRDRTSFNPPSHEMWYRQAIDFSFDTGTSKSESKDLETPNKLIKLPFTEI